ncbi:hypothetical protein INT43_004111 [Umbelopsis isabellina]|uniref:NAD-dependent epimerase/dehydratase domain-containing protein n=1 Tax=Mortierella isabellina TaxID=91625 RepID=A0A8H7PCE1_MORIS|nr:hypothetical protein INT43_004111 [Umbelopsis isabellina]
MHIQALVTGANGYIGNIVACAFRRPGWITDDFLARGHCRSASSTLNAIVSTTEKKNSYIPHFKNTIHLLRTLSIASSEGGVRPTNVFGRSASYYRGFFEIAAHCVRLKQLPSFPVPPNSNCHALHVDDCADAYVAIAGHPRQKNIEGQIFNMSSRRYETVKKISKAVFEEYGLAAGFNFGHQV